jgi:hypothetical protein
MMIDVWHGVECSSTQAGPHEWAVTAEKTFWLFAAANSGVDW